MTETLRFADQRPPPGLAEDSAASSVALRAPSDAAESCFLPLDMHSLLQNILYIKCSQCTVQRNRGPGEFTRRTALGYTYPPEFPQPSRARIEAVKVRAGVHLDDCKQQLNTLADLESEVRRYVLGVFDAFATEALALAHRGVWSVERVDREAR